MAEREEVLTKQARDAVSRLHQMELELSRARGDSMRGEGELAAMRGEMSLDESASNTGPAYLQLMEAIESQLDG